ncbi:hypothetical protein F0562_004727 [Nyssa sinensis]|uniref:Uncharacterized protein n=1 Tax=Nyssa sinensis TaxID=561372 RepID=A0A5J5BZA1_9ASTE|nr:hypothetical protein F0562_004727 [Nyssa sinensis]
MLWLGSTRLGTDYFGSGNHTRLNFLSIFTRIKLLICCETSSLSGGLPGLQSLQYSSIDYLTACLAEVIL